MSVMVIKRGDLYPPLIATLSATDENDALVAVDLTTATTIMAIGRQGGQRIIERAVTGNAQGEVELDWEAGDTDRLGYIYFEFVVTWPNGREQTFPQDGYVRARVALDNGES